MAAGSPGRSQLSGRQGLKLAVRNGVNVFYISYTEMELLVEKRTCQTNGGKPETVLERLR